MQYVYKDCYAMDKQCYEELLLTEDILMEHAALGMAEHIFQKFPKYEEGDSLESIKTVLIVAGPGNNGADGIALARLLFGFYKIKLYLPFGLKTDMSKKQFQRIKNINIEIVSKIDKADIVVDALYGAGLNRTLDEVTKKLIIEMKMQNAYSIACDIPTGLDINGNPSPQAFYADTTITMGAYKEALYSDYAKEYAGDIVRVDLGIHHYRYIQGSQYCARLLENKDLFLPNRNFIKVSHKGTFGHVAIFCGEKEGAGIIAGMASASFGAGLTTLVVHDKVSPPAYLMHATVVPDNATALAIGMGLGRHFESEFLQKYVLNSHLPIVLDADAFLSAELLSVLEQKDREIVITPHPKEFVTMWKILTGEELSVAEVQSRCFEMVRRFNAKYPHVTLLLKGSNTLIMREEQLYINPLGCSKLSKGGSGDVLSGLIVALLAQGYTGVEAAIQGSLALVMAANNYKGSSYAMLPTDIIEEVSRLEIN
ncbi:NAD(P)HX epimerase / NAD(P)HX dehydratase [hydrothermal vent metagenome]|uniref:Nicotinamide nucleotide repair protein n=1 Tax=hydrothermal vent metagenome TaxID=652676 RepID=A0A1W1CIV0_9ZZZZ